MNPEYAASMPDPTERLLPYVRQVMNVHSVVRGEAKDQASARFVGRLTMDSEEAYTRLSREFERMGNTLIFRTEGEDHAALAIPGLIRPAPSNPLVNLALFVVTLASVVFSGLLKGF